MCSASAGFLLKPRDHDIYYTFRNPYIFPVCCIGGSRVACQAHAIPYGTQFFHFHIHFHRKASALEVHAPLTGARPPWEILDPPLCWNYTFLHILEFFYRLTISPVYITLLNPEHV